MNHPSNTCEFWLEKSCAAAVLSDPELELLSGKVERVSYEKGEILFREGALNSHIFYLRSGLVKMHMKVSDQRNFILNIAKSPCFLGLPTIFGDKVNQYSATALTQCGVCIIDILTFKHMIHHNGAFAYEIIADISRDDLHIFRRYVQLTHKQTPGRLAGVLLFFADEVYNSLQFDLPLARNEVAELLGLSREIVTRALSQFHEDGLIGLDRKQVTILDHDMLKEIYRSG